VPAESSNDLAGKAVALTRLTPVVVRILYLEENSEFVTQLVHALRERKGWEVTHADNTGEARALARKQPVDVALLSATMPDIDPVALAEELTQLHPKLTTFILAPEGDSKGASAFASGRFQWLPRQDDPVALIAAMERMSQLVSWLTSNTTLELVSGLHSLPPIPSNYQGVIRAIHAPDSSLQDIGEAISKDMGMTSRVLQVANSAYYGYSNKITSPSEASLLLGIETLKSLVRYTHVLNNFPQTAASNAIFEKVWRHSVGVAAVARKIAMMQTQDETLAEEAFTAGLLHDIGKLVLVSLKPEEYKDVMRQAYESKSLLHTMERVKLGTTHAETGAYLLSLWGIPFSILEAVAWHHFPGECKDKRFSALTAVHVANVAEHRRKDTDNVKPPALDDRYIADLGLAPQAVEWLKVAPDQPKSESDIPYRPYVVQPAQPAKTEPPTPWWIWALLAVGALVSIWIVISILRE
jgi:putative nucleotidyltransferase with HDIG domain